MYSLINYQTVVPILEFFRYSDIRNQLMTVVFPKIHGENRGDKYFNSETALVFYSWLRENASVSKDAKEEIDAIRRTSNIKEKMPRFRTLLETEDSGVLKATVDHFMKDDYDVATSLKLIDTGESHVISCRIPSSMIFNPF